jgi:hypothetical protein
MDVGKDPSMQGSKIVANDAEVLEGLLAPARGHQKGQKCPPWGTSVKCNSITNTVKVLSGNIIRLSSPHSLIIFFGS